MTQQFIEFFQKFFLPSKDLQSIRMNVILFSSLLKKFIDDNGITQSLHNSWNNDIKPFFEKSFPVTNIKGFNQNADLKFLLDLIEQDMKNKPIKKDVETKIIDNEKKDKGEDSEIKMEIKKTQDNFEKQMLSNENNKTELELNKSKTMVNKKKIEIKEEYEEIDKKEDELYFKKNNKTKAFEYIELNLFLKNIIFNSFMATKKLIIYHFCQQCFCFIDRKLLFKKLLNCFLFYKGKKTSFSNIKHFIDFVYFVTLEMVEYYNLKDLKDKEFDFVKNFYLEIINYIISLIIKQINMKVCDGQYNNNKIINKNLAFHENEDNVKINPNTMLIDNQNTNSRKKYNSVCIPRYSDLKGQKSKMSINTNNEELNSQKAKYIQQMYDEYDIIFLIERVTKEEKCLVELEKVFHFLNGENLNEKIHNIKSILKIYEPLIDKEDKKDTYFNNSDNDLKEVKRSTNTCAIKNNKSLTLSSYSKDINYFNVIIINVEVIGNILINKSQKDISAIRRSELYCTVFLKKDKKTTSPNVYKSIQHFNNLISFIIEDILSYEMPKERAAVYEKWLQICSYCKSKNDFNDCVAIYSALNHYIISGLELTLKEIKSTRTKKLFQEISLFCSCDGNYKKIREEMLLLEKKGERFIPYLGMLLRDLNYYEEKFKYILDNGCINLEKIEIVNNVIKRYLNNLSEEIESDKKGYEDKFKFFENLEEIPEQKLEELGNNVEPIYKVKDEVVKGRRLTKVDKDHFQK